MNAFSSAWRSLPAGTRRTIVNLVKLGITVGAFYALLTFPVGGDKETGRAAVPLWRALSDYIGTVDPGTFILWSLVAMAVKFVGVIASAYGWSLLLKGQGLVYPFWQQIMTAFLIGRFIGTFLPSTIGLDAYTLYEAGRYSNQWHRVIIAKALEKFIGIAGLFAGILITLPAGYLVMVEVVGDRALMVTGLIGGVCGGITGAVLIGLLRPGLLLVVVDKVGGILPGGVAHHVKRFAAAATAYQGKVGLLMATLLAKFVTHFTTAVVYYFTALAIGVVGVAFLPIVFGSLIQILGTLFSPTIAGEGAREAVQALLLSSHLGGVAQAVLSAALGFVAAEAATMWGGVFLWTRNGAWRPTFMLVDGKQVDYAWIPADAGAIDRVRAIRFRQITGAGTKKAGQRLLPGLLPYRAGPRAQPFFFLISSSMIDL
jgi:hypothetical protein